MYQRAHSPLSMCLWIWPQLSIKFTSIPIWQMSFWRIWRISAPLGLPPHPGKMNVSVGHFSTQTCGVLHPNNGTCTSIQFSRSKNSKCGLLITLLSTPHFRPAESVGTSKRSKSPCFIAIRIIEVFNYRNAVFSVHFVGKMTKMLGKEFGPNIFRVEYSQNKWKKKLTVVSNEAPTAQKHDKNEQTQNIGAGTFRQWTFEIYIVL